MRQMSNLKLAGSIVLSVLLMVGGLSIASSYFELAQFPGSLFEAQLAFRAELIESQYQTMLDQGTFRFYVITQVLDYLFIIGLGCVGYFIHVAISRIYEEGTLGYKAARFGGWLVVTSAVLDALENVVVFILLSNPTEISPVLAGLYSTLALLKWSVPFFFGPLMGCVELVIYIRHRMQQRQAPVAFITKYQ